MIFFSRSDEENHSAATSEQLDDEIEVDAIPSTPVISSPMPQFTGEEAGVEELEDEDVDIGCTTHVLPRPVFPGNKFPEKTVVLISPRITVS